jgi:hypothetical protein
MRNCALLLFCGLMAWAGAMAQNPLVRLTATGHKGAVTVYLSRFDFHEAVPIDSANVGAGREVALGRSGAGGLGMYLLELDGQRQHLILHAGATQSVHARLEGEAWQALCPDSREQDALNVLLNLSTAFARQMDSLDAAIDGVSPFHPRHDSIVTALDTLARRRMRAFNTSLAIVPMLFAGTYTARILVPLDHIVLRSERAEWVREFDSDMAFNHAHHLDRVPWAEAGLLTNPFLAQKAMSWLADYCGHTEDEILFSVNVLMGKAAQNPPVRKALARMLMAFFTEKGAEGLAKQIGSRYLSP